MDSTPKYHVVGTESQDDSSAKPSDHLEQRMLYWNVKTGRSRAWAIIQASCWAINFVLLLIVLALLVQQRQHEAKNEYQVTGDLTGFAPQFPLQIETLVPNLGFVPANTSDFWSDSVQNKWLSIVPRGLGYIHVDHPSEYNNLPNPILDYNNMTVFTTSVTHQLHCLFNILAVYSAITGSNPNGIHTEMTFHLQHCFEYLRLNILCCGDVALEGAQTTFPNGTGGSDGWDAKHVCKDYQQVYDYLDKNRANDHLWI